MANTYGGRSHYSRVGTLLELWMQGSQLLSHPLQAWSVMVEPSAKEAPTLSKILEQGCQVRPMFMLGRGLDMQGIGALIAKHARNWATNLPSSVAPQHQQQY